MAKCRLGHEYAFDGRGWWRRYWYVDRGGYWLMAWNRPHIILKAILDLLHLRKRGDD